MTGITTFASTARRRRWSLLAAAVVLAAPLPALAARQKPAPAVVAQPALWQLADADLRSFYRARQDQPLWFSPTGELLPAAVALTHLVQTADVDGAHAGSLPVAEVSAALGRLQSEPSASNRMAAEVLLTRAFVDYVKLTRGADRAEMLYEHPMMQPSVPGSQDVLWEAARAPSLEDYVKTMAWMHPLYAPLREALVSGQYGDAFARQALQATLTRVRAIPAKPAGRYVLVDTAGARLWMYEDGKPVDSMKVVVGKADHATPMMAGFIRYAISNPYWNVPTELVRTKTAPAVLSQGMAYLKVRGYEVLSGWDDEATVVDTRTVDWKAVASGAIELRVRQRPNAGNAMGKVKYEFPNQLGIYLHDTPEKNLMLKDARQFSNGCIRLEDADRLGRWLLRQPLPSAGAPEQRIDLPEPVPVYVTYLTALPTGGHIAFVQDPYGRDAASRPMLAAQGGAAVAAR